MRKILMALAAAAVMLTGVELSAQSSKPVSLGIAAGPLSPLVIFRMPSAPATMERLPWGFRRLDRRSDFVSRDRTTSS